MEIVLNKDNFESEVLKATGPVFVDFWATWCGPCRMVAPHVEKLSEEFAGRLKVCKLDVDEAPEVAASYGVSSIPTLAVFKNGEIVNRRMGASPYPLLKAMVEPYV